MKLIARILILIIIGSLVQAQENTTPIYMQAGKAFRSGDYSKAISIAKSISQSDPTFENAQLLIGYCYLKLDSLEEAEITFYEIINKNNFSAQAHNGLGLVYYNSITDEKVVIKFFKNLFMESNESRAEKMFLRAIEINKKYPEALHNLVKLYFRLEDEEKYISAENILFSLVNEYPEENDYKLLLGRIKSKLGKFKEARKILQSVVDEGPKKAVAHLELAFIELKQKNYDKFSQHYLAGIRNLKDKQFLERIFKDTYDILSEAQIEQIQCSDIEGMYYFYFWTKRDPDLATDINERLVIHYKRLIHARDIYCADTFTGYDDRGMIYVRYGKPHQKYVGESLKFIPNDVDICDNESWVYNIMGRTVAFDFACTESTYNIIDDLSELIRNQSYYNIATLCAIRRLYEERTHLSGPYTKVINAFGDIPRLDYKDRYYDKSINQVSQCLLIHHLDKIKSHKGIPKSTI